MTSRRGFLIGALASATSGLILPSFYERALAYIDDHGCPCLSCPRNAGQTLFARFDVDTWYLTLSEPLNGLSEMNWAEIWTMAHGSVEAGLVADHGYTFEQLARVTDPRILEYMTLPRTPSAPSSKTWPSHASSRGTRTASSRKCPSRIYKSIPGLGTARPISRSSTLKRPEL